MYITPESKNLKEIYFESLKPKYGLGMEVVMSNGKIFVDILHLFNSFEGYQYQPKEKTVNISVVEQLTIQLPRWTLRVFYCIRVRSI